MAFNILLVLIGLGALTVGGDLLVKGASKTAALLNVSPLLIGLTIVSFGTSAPELIVSIKASLQDKAALSLANVIGSNLFNTLLILGACAFIRPLFVDRQILKFDLPALVFVSLVFLGFSQRGALYPWQGWVLILFCFSYVGCLFYRSRKKKEILDIEVDLPCRGEQANLKTLAKYGLYTLTGFLLLIFGARWLIDGSVAIARHFYVSDTLIGLTIIATGTSLPEFFASFMATLRGEKEIAIGNVMGSNIYNISIVAGSAAAFSPSLLTVSSSLFYLDISLLVVTTVILYPMISRHLKVTLTDGIFLFTTYCFYIFYVVIRETKPELKPILDSIFKLIVGPTLFLYVVYVVTGFLSKLTGRTKNHRSF